MIVAQLVEWLLLPAREIHNSNPVIGNIINFQLY